MGDIKKTICDRAWNYPVINFFNNEVSMCCHAVHQKVKEKDIDLHGKDIFTKHDSLMQAKLDLLEGNQTPNCSYCWYLENKGMKSSRHSWNQSKKYFDELQADLEDKDKTINITSPKIIEISLGNTCDLKCMYCNNIFSTQWAVENIKYGELPKDYFDKATNTSVSEKMENAWWDWFENGNIHNEANSIGFIGGEPLIIDKTYEYIHRILEKCKTRTTPWPITLSIVTNLNTPETHFNKLLNLIPEITSNRNVYLDLSVSIESLNDRAEFIRTGLRWERFQNNLETILQLTQENRGRIYFSFMIALNSLCISDFSSFIRWVVTLQKKYKTPINLRGSQVVFPNWLSPTILPKEYSKFLLEAKTIIDSEKLIDGYYKYGTWTDYSNHLDEVIKGIEDTDNDVNRNDFVRNINLLCERRKLDFKATFPEMIEFYNNIEAK